MFHYESIKIDENVPILKNLISLKSYIFESNFE